VAFRTKAALTPYTDPYFRGFDDACPDFYRYKEWERAFDDNSRSFSTAIDILNTPDRAQADNNCPLAGPEDRRDFDLGRS
jgi:hypothetical protein